MDLAGGEERAARGEPRGVLRAGESHLYSPESGAAQRKAVGAATRDRNLGLDEGAMGDGSRVWAAGGVSLFLFFCR